MTPKKRATQAELREELRGKVDEIVNRWRLDPATVAEYLAFATRFHRYSHANTKLLYAQKPDICFVASAAAFHAGLPDRSGKPLSDKPILIRKGEHALRVWCPTVQKLVHTPDGNVLPLSRLSDETAARAISEGWKVTEKQDFILVPVFDIGQTDVSPQLMPKILGMGEEQPDCDLYIRAATVYAQNELHCPVQEKDLRSFSVRGYYSPLDNEIALSDRLRGDAKLSTLLHEIGHAELHNDPSACNLSTAQKELEADMYALMLESTMHVSTTDTRKQHLATHFRRFREELKREQEKMQKADPKCEDMTANAEKQVFDRVINRYRQQIPSVHQAIRLVTGTIAAQQQTAVPDLTPTQTSTLSI